MAKKDKGDGGDKTPGTYDFPAREANYNDNIGAVIGKFAVAAVEADNHAKDAYVARIASLVAMPNVEFEAETSIIGMQDTLKTHVSTPVLSVTQANPFQVEEATISMDMTTSSSAEDSKSSSKQGGFKGSAKVGYGPFSVGISISGSMSTSQNNVRKSDYRSHTHAELKMRQGATPEGLALILDSLNQVTAAALDINRTLIQQKVGQLSGEAADGGGDAPAPAPAE